MTLFKGIAVQWRVIHAVIMRETTTRYGDSKIGFLWAFFEPLMHVGTFILIFSMIGRTAPIGDNIPSFILTGIIPWLMFNHIVAQVMSGLTSNKALLSYPHVMPIDIAFARTLLEFATLTMIFLICLLVWKYSGAHIAIDNVLGMIASILTLVAFALGIGLFNTAIALKVPSYDRMFRNAMRPMYFMSGVFFTADSLPLALQKVLVYNPILHLIEWFRSDFFTNYESTYLDKNYLFSTVVVALFLGLLAERLTRKMARQL